MSPAGRGRRCCRSCAARSRWRSLFRQHPELLIGARLGSPLVVGYGEGETYLGSDALALAPLTQQIAYLDEGDWVVITRDGAQIYRHATTTRSSARVTISGATALAIEKGNYRHFMLKEIYEQPIVVAQTLRSYLRQVEQTVALPQIDFDLSAVKRITIVACGTSFYAGHGRQILVRAIRARCPSISMSPANSAIATRCSKPGGLALFISPIGRDRRHARRAAPLQGGRAEDRAWSSTCRPARWRARPTCCCRPMPGPRSASPRPRRLPASSRCWPRWRRTSRSRRGRLTPRGRARHRRASGRSARRAQRRARA